MLSRWRGVASRSELHAFEAVDRCCREAYRDYQAAGSAADSYRLQALNAATAGDLRTAVLCARRELPAERERRMAWQTHRESVQLLLALVRQTSCAISTETVPLSQVS